MTPEERDQLAEAVAVRVVEMLREPKTFPTAGNFDRPLAVAEVADLLGRSPDWVRDHRHRLGVLPSEGKRPRLMFDAAKVREAMRAPALSPVGDTSARRTRPLRRTGTPELLPVRGRAA